MLSPDPEASMPQTATVFTPFSVTACVVETRKRFQHVLPQTPTVALVEMLICILKQVGFESGTCEWQVQHEMESLQIGM